MDCRVGPFAPFSQLPGGRIGVIWGAFNSLTGRSGLPCRHRVPSCNYRGLLYRFGGVVVVMGFAILFFQEVDPIGRGVIKEVGEYAVGGPKPAKFLIP